MSLSPELRHELLGLQDAVTNFQRIVTGISIEIKEQGLDPKHQVQPLLDDAALTGQSLGFWVDQMLNADTYKEEDVSLSRINRETQKLHTILEELDKRLGLRK